MTGRGCNLGCCPLPSSQLGFIPRLGIQSVGAQTRGKLAASHCVSTKKLIPHCSSRYYIDKHSLIMTLAHPYNRSERAVRASVRVLDIKQRSLQTRAVRVVWRRLMNV